MGPGWGEFKPTPVRGLPVSNDVEHRWREKNKNESVVVKIN
jgi:hypothetical protein